MSERSQHSDATCQLARNSRLVFVLDNVIIDAIMKNRAVDFSVPNEMFVGRAEYHRAVAVVNVNTESEIVDVFQMCFRDAEIFIVAVAVWRDGVRQ